MIEDFIYATLQGLVADQVYPNQAPPGTVVPYIVYRQVSGNSTVEGGDTIESDRWQFDIYSTQYRQGKILARQVRDALPSSGVHSGICIVNTRLDGPVDEYDSNVERDYVSVDLLIDYIE